MSSTNLRRPPIHPKNFWQWLCLITGTFFGSGLLPKAPGTWGTFAALPFCWVLAGESLSLRIAFIFFLLGSGTLASAEIQRMTRCGDHQSIVIDEAMGVAITLLLTAADWRWFLLGALLFRFFDILKPPPVGAIDRWSKDRGENPYIGGFGVMADDGVAGIQAFVVLSAIQWTWPMVAARF